MTLNPNSAKQEVLQNIAGARVPVPAGRALFRIGHYLVHIRYCAEKDSTPTKFKFNINASTRSADFELWVCGAAESYYLIPASLISRIYDDPETYVDRTHPALRIVNVDILRHRATYARGATSADLSRYFRAQL